jgi:hypothetical protein
VAGVQRLLRPILQVRGCAFQDGEFIFDPPVASYQMVERAVEGSRLGLACGIK